MITFKNQWRYSELGAFDITLASVGVCRINGVLYLEAALLGFCVAVRA
jgi:hypothetical protein